MITNSTYTAKLFLSPNWVMGRTAALDVSPLNPQTLHRRRKRARGGGGGGGGVGEL